MEKRLVKLSNKARYILETLKGTIDLRRKSNVVVTELLTSMKFDVLDGDFKYLVKMPMDSVTDENVAGILKERDTIQQELDALKAMTLEKMWCSELEVLETKYVEYKKHREVIQSGTVQAPTKKKISIKGKK
jgi:hypothetical protein